MLKGLGYLGDLARKSRRVSDVVEHSVNAHIHDRVSALGGGPASRQRSVLPILDAGKEIADADFAHRLAQIAVPVGLLVTAEDHSVDPMAQLHTSWTGADVILRVVQGGHDVCLTNPEALGVELHALIEEVAKRAHLADRVEETVDREWRQMSGRA